MFGRRFNVAHLLRAAFRLALPGLGSAACGYVGIAWNEPPSIVERSGGTSALGGAATQGGAAIAGGADSAGGDSSLSGSGSQPASMGNGGTSVGGSGGVMAQLGGATAASGGAENLAGAPSDGGSSAGGSDPGAGGDSGNSGGSGSGGSVGSTLPACTTPGPTHDTFSTKASYGTTAAPGVWVLDTQYTDNSGSARWLGTFGNLLQGSLQLEVLRPKDGGRQVLFPRTVGRTADLRGKTLVAHVFVQTGADVRAFVFAQSKNFAWANGDGIDLPIGQWVCVGLEIDRPSAVEVDFDPRDILTFGVEIERDPASSLTDSVAAYLDDFSY